MRIANERTLELNVIHQLLSSFASSFAVGATQKAESETGIDSGIQTPYTAALFQFKASNPSKGRDGDEAHFLINNNQRKDQHVKLHRLGTVFRNMVFYGLPLVVSDAYFQARAGDLIPVTIFVSVETLPGFSQGHRHRIKVFSNCAYYVSSEPHEGKGISGKEFMQALKTRDVGLKVGYEKRDLTAFIKELHSVCREVELHQRLIRIAFFHERRPFAYTLRFSGDSAGGDEAQRKLFP